MSTCHKCHKEAKKVCITNRKLVQGDFLHKIREVAQDADIIILREKDLSEEEYRDLAQDVIAICQAYGKFCILHHFVHVAKQLHYPHIHLSMEEAIALQEEERQFFDTIGVSVHSVNEAQMVQDIASYITASHIFETECKPGVSPRGLQFLSEVVKAVNIPVYALGGIHPENMKSCIDAGAAAVCMMSEYMQGCDRYERQMIVPGMGQSGQERLRAAKVLIVGAGGLGSPVIQYLAGAGVGELGILDGDKVSLSNLHRQVIHPTQNLGKNKAESAKEYVYHLNSEVTVRTYPFFLTAENAWDTIKEYDFVVDCVDNFETKFLINDVCVGLGKAFCHAGVWRLIGQVMTYIPSKPCYRCVFEEVPDSDSVPSAAQMGVIPAMVGIIGSIQALEVIKYFTGMGELLTGKMYVLDGATMTGRIAKFSKPSEHCRACGSKADNKELL